MNSHAPNPPITARDTPTPIPADAPVDRPPPPGVDAGGVEVAEEGELEVEEEEEEDEVPLQRKSLIRPCCCCEMSREQLKSVFQGSIVTVPETKVRDGRMLGPEELVGVLAFLFSFHLFLFFFFFVFFPSFLSRIEYGKRESERK